MNCIEVEGKGRCAFATKPLAAGDVILQERPLCTVVDNDMLSVVCARCFRCVSKRKVELERLCNECHCVRYCSEFCQANHRHNCTAFHAISKLKAPSEILTTFRLLATLVTLDGGDLVSYLNDVRPCGPAPSDGDIKALRKFHQVLFSNGADASSSSSSTSSSGSGVDKLDMDLLRSLCVDNQSIDFTSVPPSQTLALIIELFHRDRSNGFALVSLDPHKPKSKFVLQARGFAALRQAVIFNHSCVPNAARRDTIGFNDSDSLQALSETQVDPVALDFVALRSIRPGEELCLNYVPLSWTCTRRRRKLSEEYGFDCVCERCELDLKCNDFDEFEEADPQDVDEEFDATEEDDFKYDEDGDAEDNLTDADRQLSMVVSHEFLRSLGSL